VRAEDGLHVEADLRQALRDLGLECQVRIEKFDSLLSFILWGRRLEAAHLHTPPKRQIVVDGRNETSQPACRSRKCTV